MKISAVTTEQGSGTPVVLLHSSMSSKAQWGKLSQLLESRFRVIAIDLYGYGDAAFPQQSETFSLEDEAERIKILVHQLLGETPFHLIGHSYGGATALRVVHDIQPQLLSLGLYEPVAFHLLPDSDPGYHIIDRVSDEVAQQVEAGEISAGTQHFINFWSGEGTYQSLDVQRQQAFDRFIKKVVLDFQAGFGEPLGLDEYKKLVLPVCLIRSPDSPLPTRQIAGLLSETLSNLEFHEVHGGHMAPITHAQFVNPIFEKFLLKIDDEPRVEMA